MRCHFDQVPMPLREILGPSLSAIVGLGEEAGWRGLLPHDTFALVAGGGELTVGLLALPGVLVMAFVNVLLACLPARYRAGRPLGLTAAARPV